MASKYRGACIKLWYARSQLPVYDQFDKYSSKFDVLIIHEIQFSSPNQISCWLHQGLSTSFRESQYDGW